MRQQHFGVVLSLALVVCVLLGACASKGEPTGPTSAPEKKEPYKIGLITTLSGTFGFHGTDIRDAAQLEVERVNAGGGIEGHPIELVVEDDGMDPSKAATAFARLVQQEKVLAVMGILVAPVDTALEPLAEREQVPLLATNPTTPERRGKYKYAFNTNVSEMVRASVWVDILRAKGYSRVAAIGGNDPVLKPALDELKKHASAQGITVEILPDYVNFEQVDLTPQVVKLKELISKNQSQAVVTTVFTSQIPTLLRTMKQMGINVPVIGVEVNGDYALLDMGGDELNGFIVPSYKLLAPDGLPDSDPQKRVVVDFKNRYEAKTGRKVSTVAGLSHDGINIILNALRQTGPDRTRLRDAIENMKYVGTVAIFNFSPTDHEAVTKESFVTYEIQNKKFVLLQNL